MGWWVDFYMSKKENQILKFREFVNSPLSSGSLFAGLNLCDVYLNIRDRDYVLDTINYRFPTATEDLNSAEDWFEKISSLKSEDAYINAFVGQHGEYKAIEKLESMGKSAEMFNSRIHPDNDLIDSDGISWSVKSYSADNISSLKSVISDHPNATNYIINSEAYEKLKSTGDLHSFESKGVQFLDGDFSHEESLKLGQNTFEKMTGSIVDEIYDGIWDDIPVVAGVVTLCNVGLNIKRHVNNEITQQEAYFDIIRSISKLTVASGGAAVGGSVGASIGSAIFPIAGTVIGGGVGIILGAIGARELTDDFFKNKKYEDVRKSYSHFYKKYVDGIPKDIIVRLQNRFYHKDKIEKLYFLENNRLKNFKDQLDIQSSLEPTLSAVLVDETVKRLKSAVDRIENSTSEIYNSLINFCIDYSIKKYPRERKKSKLYAQHLYGALFAENDDWLLNLDSMEQQIIINMKTELEKFPNNAFTLEITKEKLLGTILLLNLKAEKDKD